MESSVQNTRSASREDRIMRLFGPVRSALRAGDKAEVERALYKVERAVVRALEEMRSEANAVAEANVRGIEIYENQVEVAQELADRNATLVERAAELERLRAQLEAQSRAAADATVEAMFMFDESSTENATLRNQGDALKRMNDELSGQARELEVQANALAQSNARAVEIIQDTQEACEELEAENNKIAARSRNLEELAFMDSLTGLFNHRYLREQIRIEVERARRYRRSLSVVFVDVDHFKKLNDTHGHAGGDIVLRQLSAMLKDVVRAADIPVRMDGAPFAARYGGEEFVVLLPETDLEGAAIVAERLRKRIEEATFPGGETQPLGRVTISAGVGALESDDDGSRLLERADAALYQAKHGGRNRVERALAA